MIRLIEALGRGPVHLIGNSMGGAVSIRVAAARPDLVKTLTLVSPVLPDRRPHRATVHFPILTLPFVGAAAGAPLGAGAAGEPGGRRLQHVLLRPGRRCTPTGSRRRWPRCAGATSSATTRPRWSARREPWSARRSRPRPLSLWRAAERVQAPTLVLFGSHDRLVSPALAVPAARAFKNAQVEVLPHIGHIGQMERPDLVAARFREMVDRAGMPGGGTRLTPDELTST